MEAQPSQKALRIRAPLGGVRLVWRGLKQHEVHYVLPWAVVLAVGPFTLEAQDRVGPLTSQHLQVLLKEGVAAPRILSLIAGGCVENGSQPAVQQELATAGASLEILRSAERFDCEPRREGTLVRFVSPPTSVAVGSAHVLEVSVVSPDGHQGTLTTGAWSVADPAILEVTSRGEIRGVRPGRTEVVVLAEGARASITISVHQSQALLVVQPADLTLGVGERQAVVAEVRDQGSGESISREVNWRSSDPAVAVVDGGLVMGIAPGTTVVEAHWGSLIQAIRVGVHSGEPVRLMIDPERHELEVGERIRYSASAYSSAGAPVKVRGAAWAVGDSSIANIDAMGQVTGLSPGLTRVVFSTGAVEAEALVRVFPSGHNTGGILLAGLVFPGGGQFLLGRPARGFLTLLASGAVMAARGDGGFGNTDPVGNVEQPLLAYGIAVASAINATSESPRRNAQIRELRVEPWGGLVPDVSGDRRLSLGLRVRLGG